MPSFTLGLEQALRYALSIANANSHESTTIEHLLLALIEENDARRVMQACNVDTELLSQQLKMHIMAQFSEEFQGNTIHTKPTNAFQRVLQRALIHARSSGYDKITGANILVAIFSESESYAATILQQQNVTRYDVVNYISHDFIKKPSDSEQAFFYEEESELKKTNELTKKTNALSSWCHNLNEKVKAGKINPVIGRENEINRTIQILCRKSKNNPLYVGDPGVGKTAIAEGLAWHIMHQKVPQILLNATIFSLDIGMLVAGTRYRGDFEDRIKQLLHELEEFPDSILFIDEIHTIIGAGSTSGGTVDAANLLKPALSSGTLRCIGATSYKEYRHIFEKDQAMARRFQKIDVHEPSIADAIVIMQGLKGYFEKFHQVKYTDEAIKASVELSAFHITGRKLPDKAIDIIDETGAAQMLLPEKKRKKIIGLKEIEATIAAVAQIPVKSVSRNDQYILAKMDTELKQMVYGQDQAIDTLVSAIRLARAGLNDHEKPIGSYLFSGPTGVGKTELARQLAFTLGIKLLRFDMSEYMEKHSVARLIGAPPGYVGFEQGGALTDAVAQTPYTVLLLDEIEKAHPDLFHIFLQIMDYGKLTDHNGRQIDFRHVIFIMTSNAGAEALAKSPIGFGKTHRVGEDIEEINKIFTPEFRNRLDAIIPFQQLESDIIIRVVQKFILQLEIQLKNRNVTLKINDAAIEWLAEQGYDATMGARPLSRLIQEKIKKPLANEILFGLLQKGGFVHIGLRNGQSSKLELVLDIISSEKMMDSKGNGSYKNKIAEMNKKMSLSTIH